MGHYRSNVRDLEFNLFEVLGLGDALDSGSWGDLDPDTVRAMLQEMAKIAEGPLAEPFASADRNPPTFDPQTHSVTLPDDFSKAFNTFWDAGWSHLAVDPRLGGTPAPQAVRWAIAELVLGAQPAAFMYASGPTSADIFYRQATDEQKKWAQIMAERRWGSTMVLTEPDAGSDVGAGRTKAIRQDDGSWHIEGVKRFITSADSGDLFENIVHFVLARPEGAVAGTKGLSLFFVPKHHFDASTGELLERNGVVVTGLEHKMGLKVSATCELTFGADGVPAKGWLVGEVHNGISQMFDIIEHARMFVGTKAIATLSTGYLNALEYAKQRLQGADMTRMADKDAPRVPIIRHPDVRRSLALQKAYAEGLRALYLYTAAHQDAVVAAAVSGADDEMAARVGDLLLPIVKGVGSERASQYLNESLQTLGGSGFLQDFPIEQYVRDAKIDSLYEGTTAIQAQDFFFRKIVRDQGVAFAHVRSEIEALVGDTGAHPRTARARAALGEALDAVEEITSTLVAHLMAARDAPTELYRIGLASVRYLLAVGDLVIGWQLLRGADVALRAIDAGGAEDRDFYEGKVFIANYFAENVLPGVVAATGVLSAPDLDIMQTDDAVF
ncbi:acyl-CoA dehydrogenase [Gordonia sp. NPDC003376]